jgi:hypothetical protein
MYDPSEEELTRAEPHINAVEVVWREHYGSRVLVAEVEPHENPMDKTEVYTFAFGLMASIVRTAQAVVILTREGYGVECRAMFRSLLDQALALQSLNKLGVHAVHAFGKQHAFNLKQLKDASQRGFPLGRDNEEYIEKFLELSGQLPTSDESKAAQNSIKSSQAGAEPGSEGAMLYQMWLEATPLSKPSMRLSDAYVETTEVAGGYRIDLHLDGDPTSIVDARLVLSAIVPRVLVTYAEIVNDPILGLQAITLAESTPRAGSH